MRISSCCFYVLRYLLSATMPLCGMSPDLHTTGAAFGSRFAIAATMSKQAIRLVPAAIFELLNDATNKTRTRVVILDICEKLLQSYAVLLGVDEPFITDPEGLFIWASYNFVACIESLMRVEAAQGDRIENLFRPEDFTIFRNCDLSAETLVALVGSHNYRALLHETLVRLQALRAYVTIIGGNAHSLLLRQKVVETNTAIKLISISINQLLRQLVAQE